MKNSLLLLIIISAFIYPQKEEKVDSKVISAVVFKNRAQVTRESQIELLTGKKTIVFSNLPLELQNETVRVSAPSPAVKILDVKVEQRFSSEIQQKGIKILEKKADSLNQLIHEADDRISIYNSKKDFIESLKSQSSRYMNEKMLLNSNSTKEWNDILMFVEKNMNDIYGDIREQTKRKAFYTEQINSINSEINESKGKKTRNYKEVIVNLEINKSGKVKLYPSYIVQNAGWYPIYDARILSDSKQAELQYFGMVQQSTGEDWENISLTLSTAEPMSVKTLPELERWFVDVRPLPVKKDLTNLYKYENSEYQITYDQNWGLAAGTGSVSGYIVDKSTGEILPGTNIIVDQTGMRSTSDANGKFLIYTLPEGQHTLIVMHTGYQAKNITIQLPEKTITNVTIPMEMSLPESNEIIIRGQRSDVLTDVMTMMSSTLYKEDDAKFNYTNIYAKELSTSFEIPSKCSIPSDNSQHKVTIAINHAPVEYSYTAVPKIIPAVYLKGKIINDNEYPLLEGEINVFVDNDFINRTHLNTIVQSDTFDLALGIDERIQVKKVLINKFQESKGLLGGSRSITYEYEIQAANNRRTEESVSVYDQLPIAMNEEINVELLEPQKEEKEIGNDKKLEWNLKLKPGEKKIIPVKYKIEFPNNYNVYGLE